MLRRRSRVLAAALCLAGVCAAHAAPAQTDRVRSRYLHSIERYLYDLHRSPDDVDVEGIAAEAARRRAAGQEPKTVSRWIASELSRQALAYMPIDPDYNASFQYRLPFDTRTPWMVGQGPGGEYSHSGIGGEAFDFAMPEGTKILAARRGTVVRIKDGFAGCCRTQEEGWKVNVVEVAHPDGSAASYVHLRAGIPVKNGQVVKAGELLAYSGNTGYSRMPHLHFDLRVRRSAGVVTVPVRFRDGSPSGYVPKTWHYRPNRPRYNLELRVRLGSRRLHSGETVVLGSRESLRLRVVIVKPDGTTREITTDAFTRYTSVTPWSLSVGPTGRVAFGTPEQWLPIGPLMRSGVGIVSIVYEKGAKRMLRRGYFDVRFEFEKGV